MTNQWGTHNGKVTSVISNSYEDGEGEDSWNCQPPRK
jgi:hypothetical protein